MSIGVMRYGRGNRGSVSLWTVRGYLQDASFFYLFPSSAASALCVSMPTEQSREGTGLGWKMVFVSLQIREGFTAICSDRD